MTDDEGALEAAAAIEFLRTQLGWEWFWADGWLGEEHVSQAKRNAALLRRYLDTTGHAKGLCAKLDGYRSKIERLESEAAAMREVLQDWLGWSEIRQMFTAEELKDRPDAEPIKRHWLLAHRAARAIDVPAGESFLERLRNAEALLMRYIREPP
jgi:hypothetical protein